VVSIILLEGSPFKLRFATKHNCNMVVFHETKLAEISAALVVQRVGAKFAL
jgi:hypothetical protein